MNNWLRLWHDMPNDPKWRTIARASKTSISEVLAVYVHFLVQASTNSERGRTQPNADEDVASALDLDVSVVTLIRTAMEGRVLDGDQLSGWETRQPKREDGSAERAKQWRERNRTPANANEPKTRVEGEKKEEVTVVLPPASEERNFKTKSFGQLTGQVPDSAARMEAKNVGSTLADHMARLSSLKADKGALEGCVPADWVAYATRRKGWTEKHGWEVAGKSAKFCEVKNIRRSELLEFSQLFNNWVNGEGRKAA